MTDKLIAASFLAGVVCLLAALAAVSMTLLTIGCVLVLAAFTAAPVVDARSRR